MDNKELDKRFREEVLTKTPEELKDFALESEHTALADFLTEVPEWDACQVYMRHHKVISNGVEYRSKCDYNTSHIQDRVYWECECEKFRVEPS